MSKCRIILRQTCVNQKDVSTKGCYAFFLYVHNVCHALFCLLHLFVFCFFVFLSRVQTGVSSLLWRVFIRGICQEAALPPLLSQWMYSALVGAGKSREWMLSVEGFEKVCYFLFGSSNIVLVKITSVFYNLIYSTIPAQYAVKASKVWTTASCPHLNCEKCAPSGRNSRRDRQSENWSQWHYFSHCLLEMHFSLQTPHLLLFI